MLMLLMLILSLQVLLYRYYSFILLVIEWIDKISFRKTYFNFDLFFTFERFV